MALFSVLNSDNSFEYTDGKTYGVLGYYAKTATSVSENLHCGDFIVLPTGVSVYEGEYNTAVMNAMVAAGSWGGKPRILSRPV